MAMIYVKVREGRRAYFEGRVIPADKFIPVPDNPYIRRLVDRWDDLEVEGGKPDWSKRPDAGKSPSRPTKPRPPIDPQ